VWAAVGLGNPGRKYSRTRHNVGFLFIKAFALSLGIKLRKRRHLSKLILADHHQEQILLAIPQTFMNASGQAVARLIENYHVTPEHTLVVYDDLICRSARSEFAKRAVRVHTKG